MILKAPGRKTDEHGMGRAAIFTLVLAALAASGWGWIQRFHQPPKSALREHAARTAATAELKEAGDQLYLTKSWAGTFDGPDLKNFQNLELVHADRQGFCIHVVKNGYAFRLIGPGGVPEPGRCQ
jgi:hypothetical protein